MSLHKQWKSHLKANGSCPTQPGNKEYVKSIELILDPDDNAKLIEVDRPPGQNKIGMVAWKLTYFSPVVPEGRTVIVIANDIVFQAGTFGTAEDDLFNLASRYARLHQLPRLYFAANSGARIGLADEVKPKFKVAWKDGIPERGMDYLYLTEDDCKDLEKSVNVVKIVDHDSGEIRYQIKDIIGAKHGLGVENLSASGLIAGETSQAYQETFTLTYVTGRTVGIGAYLARLGQRVIQKISQPILLTGFNALNKLLGREVYTSNVQLGGTDIMSPNGVSHLVCHDDLEGVSMVVNWLDYLPSQAEPQIADPVDRPIEFSPGLLPYDPRDMLAGCYTGGKDSEKWVSGFFDRGSFMELLGGWAKTAVVGRARLGGCPVGVVAVETRTIEQVIPADPAQPESKEQLVQKAGQVWYPDSACKTAQGIRDMVAENIPLFIFANWRGFSGGMRDMFDEVLKFGSHIVDSLRMYKQPVFVYIPPSATLRGGAWVVVDSTINQEFMEMYADETASGGVLEPEGTVGVKFRRADIVKTMHRLDETLMALDKELAEALNQEVIKLKGIEEQNSKTKFYKRTSQAKDGLPTSPTSSSEVIKEKIQDRENSLMPYYHTIATHFAALHDTPGRMKAKGIIDKIVPWDTARTFFYWRLRRMLLQTKITKQIEEIDDSCTWQAARKLLQTWMDEECVSTAWYEDELCYTNFQKHMALISKKLDDFRAHTAACSIAAITASMSGDSAFKGLVAALENLNITDEQKNTLRNQLNF